VSDDLLPGQTACVYRHYDRYGNLLYVGVTNRGERRMKEHAKDKVWWSVVSHTRYEHYDNRQAALDREAHLIRAYSPPFNKVHNEVSDEMRSVYMEHAPDAIVRSRPPAAADNSYGSYKYRPDKPFEERDHIGTVEVRDLDGVTRISGYAALFDTYSQDLGGFVERIAPGAFKRVLNRGDDVQAWFNHNPDNLLASRQSGSLRLEEDERGLRYEFDLDQSDPDHQRVLSKIRRGDLRGSSFGFRVDEDEWTATEQDYPLRTIKSVSALRDVGPVSQPAYPATGTIGQLALRSLAATLGRDLDELVEASKQNALRDFILSLATVGNETAVAGEDVSDVASSADDVTSGVYRSIVDLPPQIPSEHWSNYLIGGNESWTK
jgi:uncharacterized protein